MGVLGGGWTRESGGGRVWTDWVAGPPERWGGWIQFGYCGTPTTCRMYLFGACRYFIMCIKTELICR